MALGGIQGRIIALAALVLAVFAAVFGFGDQSARAGTGCSAASGAVTNFATLQTDVATAGTYTLGANLAPSAGSLTLGAKVHVTLNLAGCGLDIAAPALGAPAIAVPVGASLTVEDTSATASGTLTAVGGAAASITDGSAAGIGGNGGISCTASSSDACSAGASAGTVTLAGGTVIATPGALDGSSGAPGYGIGGGGGGLYAPSGARAVPGPSGGSGTVSATAATTTLAATLGGVLDITAGATVAVPAGDLLSVDAAGGSTASVSAGEIALAGTLSGAGTLTNSGTIVVSGSAWSIPGNGKGGAGKLTITGAIHELSFSVPAGHTTPAALWVYAPTITAGGESLPTQPAETDYTPVWESSTGPASNGMSLSGISSATLTGVYIADTSVTSALSAPTPGSLADTATVSRGAGTGSPGGTVSFYVCGPLSAASGCSSSSDEIGAGVSLAASGASTSAATSPTFTPATAGIYCVHTVYSGASGYEPSTDSATGCTTLQEPTALTTPTSSADPVSAGHALSLSATVTNASGSEALDGGTVTFTDTGGATICSAAVAASGVASCSTSALAYGVHQITAAYSGDARFLPSSETTPMTEDVDTPFSTVTTVTRALKQVPSNAVRLLSASRARTGRLTVKLKLPDAGTLKLLVTVTEGKRTLTFASEGTKLKRSETLTLTLKPTAAVLRALGRHHAKLTLKLAVRFTPTGGKLRTVKSTLRLPAN